MNRQRLPNAFNAPKVLRLLNVGAVAFAMAACTGVVLGSVFPAPHLRLHAVSYVGSYAACSTLFYAAIWAMIVRRQVKRWKTFSVVLAALDAGTACSLAFGNGLVGFLMTFVFGATIGVIVWGPALLLVLVCFGKPLFYARRIAPNGMRDQDRGEFWVGAIASSLSLLAFVLMASVAEKQNAHFIVLSVFAAIGIILGVSSAAIARTRAKRRRNYLRDVGNGIVVEHHIEVSPAPIVTRISGDVYRQTREVLMELDESGDAKVVFRAP